MLIKYHYQYKVALSFVLAVVMIFNGKVNAGIPVTDPANLANDLVFNMMTVGEWSKEAVRDQLNQMLNKQLASLGIEVEQDNAKNQIAAQTTTASDMFNLELKRESKPAPSACSSTAAAVIHRQTEKAVTCYTRSQQSAFKDENNNFNTSEEQKITQSKQKIDNIIQRCHQISTNSTAIIDEETDVNLSACLNSGLLTNNGVLQYSESELNSAELMKTIIAGNKPLVTTPANFPNNTEGNARRLLDLRRLQFKSIIDNSLDAIISQKMSDGSSVSVLAGLENFVQARYGNVDWMAKITGVHPDKTTDASAMIHETQVIREIASIQAFLANMQLLRYKQELRKESLMTALLALEFEPLK